MRITEIIKNFLWRFRWIRELTLNPNSDIKELTQVRESNSRIAEFSAYMVFIGLALEVLVILIQSEKSPLRILLEAIPSAMITLGVLGEIHFEHNSNLAADILLKKSDERIAEAEKLTAEANQKAEEARLAHEKLKSEFVWRALTPDEMHKIISVLLTERGGIEIVYFHSDVESALFSKQIASVFAMANWEFRVFPIISAAFVIPEEITLEERNPASSQTTSVVKKALEFAGIEFKSSKILRDGDGLVTAGQYGNLDKFKETRAMLFIGNKRMPTRYTVAMEKLLSRIQEHNDL